MQKAEEKLFFALSLCKKAGRLTPGFEAAAESVLKGSAALVERDPAPWFAAFDRVRWARVLRLGAKAVMDQEGYPWKNGKNSSNTGL